MYGSHTILFWFGVFPFIPPLFGPSYFSPTSLIGRFYLALVSARLYMILVLLRGFLSSHSVMNRAIRLLGLIHTSPAGPCEKASYPHPTPRSSPDVENLSSSTIPLGVQVLWMFRNTNEGLHVLSVFLLNIVPIFPKFNYSITYAMIINIFIPVLALLLKF